MSSYYFTAKNKKTGEEVKVFAIDDYFAPHEYGYKFEDGKVLREKDFWRQYERSK